MLLRYMRKRGVAARLQQQLSLRHQLTRQRTTNLNAGFDHGLAHPIQRFGVLGLLDQHAGQKGVISNAALQQGVRRTVADQLTDHLCLIT